jgi:hypothetical protein
MKTRLSFLALVLLVLGLHLAVALWLVREPAPAARLSALLPSGTALSPAPGVVSVVASPNPRAPSWVSARAVNLPVRFRCVCGRALIFGAKSDAGEFSAQSCRPAFSVGSTAHAS